VASLIKPLMKLRGKHKKESALWTDREPCNLDLQGLRMSRVPV